MNRANKHFQSPLPPAQSWSKVYTVLKDREQALAPGELYQLAIAAYLTGRDEEGLDMLARSHHRFLESGKIGEAVRCAFWTGMLFMFTGERARGSGWFSRAQRLMEERQHKGAESGFLLVPAGLSALGAGEADIACEKFKRAHEIGEYYHIADLSTLSLLGQGQAMIQLGNIAKGTALLDESMVAVESSDISPLAVGIVYCAVIETCQMIFDIRRAQEWTRVLSRWCESRPDLIPFRGQCLIRRSQIMHIHGEWSEALDEMQRACQMLSKPPGEPAAGEAYYQLAEFFRLRGDFQQAEKLYAESNKWGRKPQPGMALLRLLQGEKESAIQGVTNALEEEKASLRRIKLLPAFIEIMLAHDRMKEAHSAMEELNAVAKKYDTVFVQAIATYCQGAISLKEGEPAEAIRVLRHSSSFWQELNAPYGTGVARYLLGIAYRRRGDRHTATMELKAAQWIFGELQAVPDLKKVEALLQAENEADPHGLTLRELQVLHLISEGATNKSIADRLFVSERTVERHLSNIFNKLQVDSRTQAAAFAYKHRIV